MIFLLIHNQIEKIIQKVIKNFLLIENKERNNILKSKEAFNEMNKNINREIIIYIKNLKFFINFNFKIKINFK